ncbi:hypothetical protein A3A76_02040 [Candidatus Woesebacteria bacterium RIFCSPLOWO2_01_FULL_39_23]|uniref:HD domain-containing protein n=1 Tax=Candidatus Woesebacteria bacterium RIFCSPHIGHO2_01_FULL_40_22 TaxID=1802499 RepID=A0A1F7YH40_9BACT|nr:MAG: hypothetical protein A2141_03185 [Candidatus Woesebacteria bacterium RBG_16_40_11]OGM26179.1 MAG: hypothetical protein A2628_02470 [Candidatus Woesebacteria bacterium RIFCSPHIGHO2_01_FULL_40_22]OGM37966.1 MAG: hypothetical protein A3E41_03550 [Candidatus Woesebacteria bacterium RIFCSPHIGHO2_12_FULL_38_9]OGM62338.1 MAG: hypothetical protein A3A76_02040 [Candidatus Woesebacteria bacterium RIFCSPLOWO2_01_FULL_39_23]
MLERIFNAPEELKDLAFQSLLVPRYTRTYHEGIFRDSTGGHTLRCIDKADTLNIKQADKVIITDKLWSHDLAEVVTSDFSAIHKQNDPKLKRMLFERELEAIRTYIPEKYKPHVYDFIEAERFWDGSIYSKLPTPHALVAKTIDHTDGNVFFHKALASWVSSDEYNPDYLPSKDSLRYTFVNYHKYMERLSSPVKPFGQFYEVILNLLNDEIVKIAGFWSGVKEQKQPEIIIKDLRTIIN